MAHPTFRPPDPGHDLRLAVLVGVGFAVALFVLMALAQMMGDIRKDEQQFEETAIAYEAPEIEQIEEEEPPPPPEEEPPELEEPPPQLSLDQLDIALNPGTGGSLAGDFSLPSFASLKELGTQDFLDFSQLDQTPRPKGVFGFNFPRRLRQEKANGRIVLLLKLSHEGEVIDAQIESSNLPRFNDFVLKEVKDWEFTPPTQNGKPVNAMARLPIPIRIN